MSYQYKDVHQGRERRERHGDKRGQRRTLRYFHTLKDRCALAASNSLGSMGNFFFFFSHPHSCSFIPLTAQLKVWGKAEQLLC